MSGENIYNWRTRPPVVIEKEPMYVSTHDPTQAPLGTTFGCRGSARVNGANLGPRTRSMEEKRSNATMGPAKAKSRADPRTFLKMGTNRHSGINTKPGEACAGWQRPLAMPKRAGVPRRHERPVTGLKSGKNFVVANAVENILRAPAARFDPEIRYVDKEDYGQVPEYLGQVKSDIAAEKEMLRQMFEEQRAMEQMREYEERGEAPPAEPLAEQERKALLRQLKQRWFEANKSYQKMAHIVNLDTQSMVDKKTRLETNLDEIEQAIKTLSKPNIVVQG